MVFRALGLALWGLVCLSAAAEARVHHPARGHRIVGVAHAPLDGFTQAAGAYSFRKLRRVYAGPAIRLRRASDNAEADIGFLGFTGFTGAPWDEAAAVAHCAATTCSLVGWYDQSGNVRDLTQTTTAFPQLAFGCRGGLPCLRAVDTGKLETVGLLTPATGVVSLSAVAARTGGSGICTFAENGNNNRIDIRGSEPNIWQLSPPAGSILAPAADGVWHAGQGVINGAASVLSIDGAEVAGTVTGNVTAGVVRVLGGAATQCDIGEFVVWDNLALTPAQRSALTSNQRGFWGTP